MIASEAEARDYCRRFTDAAGMGRLEQLIALLLEENQRQNLISRKTLESVWQRHMADSAQLLSLVSRETQPWLDLGTGAGFPGLVIAALRPEWDVRLVESRKRRSEWLESARLALGLAHCRVIAQRLEVVETFSAGVISARAFAPLQKLLTLADRFSRSSTCWLLPKGRSAVHELTQLSPNTRKLFHVEQSVTDDSAGIIVGTFKGRL